MTPLKQYFILELKKTFLQLPKLLFGSFFLLVITCFCTFVIRSSSPTKEMSPIFVGVLAEKDEPFIDWIIDTANNFPDMNYSIHMEHIEKSTAEHDFFNEETNVLFIIPKNYIASIINGENKHITIRFSKTQTTVVNTLMKELAAAASSFILDTEGAIYTMHDYYKKYGLPQESKDELALNIKYVKEIIRFSDTIKTEHAKKEQEPSLAVNCICTGTVLLPLLFGLILAPIMTSEGMSLKKELHRMKIYIWKQLLVKEAVFFLTLFFCFFGIAFLFFIAQKIDRIGLDLTALIEKDTDLGTIFSDPFGVFFLLFRCSPVFLFAAAFSLCIYELTGDTSGGIVLLFFSIIFMALFSGLFYPIKYLPEFFKKTAVLFPTRHAYSYMLGMIRHESIGTHVFSLCLSSICIYLLTLFISTKRSQNT